MSRSLVLDLALRFLRGRSRHGLGLTGTAALGSTALGVTAMVVAMALMTGYTEELESKLLGSGALMIYPPPGSPLEPDAGLLEEVSGIENVEAVSYAVFSQGSLGRTGSKSSADVVVRGVEPDRGLFGASTAELSESEGVWGVVLGEGLARRLEARVGERLTLMVWGRGARGYRPRYRRLEVRGEFATGFAEFDQDYLIVHRELVSKLSEVPGWYEVTVEETSQISGVQQTVESLLDEDFIVRDWRLSNPAIFNALDLQKLLLFLLLGLIVVVSTFNVAATLVVLVREKLPEVGVLSAIGLTGRRLRRVFVWTGIGLGSAGTLLGVLLGVLVSWLMTTFRLIRFDPEVAEVYFITHVPFRVQILDLAAIVAFALAVTTIACWIGTRSLSKLTPVEALRHD
ncbi:MAG: FtsX-like permease family protein [Acidobacteriota bacterium]